MADQQTKMAELKRIYARDNKVKASTVLKESTPKKAPLHDEFEWRDEVAAHAHRLQTARRIIRTTPIVIKGVRQQLVHVPVTPIEGPTAATNDPEGAYKPVSVIAESEADYEAALRQLMTQVRSIEATIATLKAASKGHELELLPQLKDAIGIAKSTIRLMMRAA